MFTIEARLREQTSRLGEAPTLDDAVKSLNGVLGDGSVVTMPTKDVKRLETVGESFTVASPREGSVTRYVIRNVGDCPKCGGGGVFWANNDGGEPLFCGNCGERFGGKFITD
ncbi:MAG: hypothetical protein JSS68_15105 [Actinobacteria bacterium]|nr:hypothetical protein [Actinomycetota bacterium]